MKKLSISPSLFCLNSGFFAGGDAGKGLLGQQEYYWILINFSESRAREVVEGNNVPDCFLKVLVICTVLKIVWFDFVLGSKLLVGFLCESVSVHYTFIFDMGKWMVMTVQLQYDIIDSYSFCEPKVNVWLKYLNAYYAVATFV